LSDTFVARAWFASEFRDRNSVGIPASIDDMAGCMNAGLVPCSSAGERA
jgi:hypothetical protein